MDTMKIRADIAENEKKIKELKAELRSLEPNGNDSVSAQIDAIEAKVKELTEERVKLDKQLKEAEAQEQRGREDVARIAAPAPIAIPKNKLAEVRSSEAYNNAYAEYIKSGDDKECRSLLTDLVDGTVPIPTMIADAIETAWTQTNLVQRLRRTNIKGTAKYPFEYSATGASVHVEGTDAPTEEVLELGTITIEPQTLKKWITISDEVLALKGEQFLNYINAEITQRIMELADKLVVENIKGNPAQASKIAAGVPVLNLTKIDFATIFKAMAKLADGAVRPVAVMNKQTYFNTFMALEDLQGRPIYNIVSDNGKPQYYINGVEVVFNENLKANEEIIVGDFDGMIINLPEGDGVKFVTDPYSLAEKDLVKIVGRIMAGFGVVRDKYFVVVKVGSGQGE